MKHKQEQFIGFPFRYMVCTHNFGDSSAFFPFIEIEIRPLGNITRINNALERMLKQLGDKQSEKHHTMTQQNYKNNFL
ncbi:MAG: hypothetical protein HDR23_08720 [Lachnospiraceae bacterium]|nr:hypothetical protein [Lachnospiraceae bacterium]MBD5456532.1 hypothetical protein [Lachnospiraceae bacterium]